ncbi:MULTISPECIES: isochorismate synthase [Actinotignum]|uniref:isochorismate synthase n=2 Tax=Actinotignum timonense TaxID=1870995 RepID=A0AAW9HMP9_9ACTO|nr:MULTISPECIES: isochorismate synthase [Actinotignum]MDE1558645.1 isochorismate synthase [Actinotignum schaalii]MDE1663470.1 isochorismate synthase [Actinotignum schaalii]MDK6373401.1 isochorismate synthase [Actinotignum timonense]MDK6418467.1 isochorismate synthase [Actinotignum timonense]MDK6591019.1 isochorismate synthase [Actinotignum timonense]
MAECSGANMTGSADAVDYANFEVHRLRQPLPICPELFGFAPSPNISAWVGPHLALLGWGEYVAVESEAPDTLERAAARWAQLSAAARRSGQTGQTERNGHNARTARTGHKNTQKYDDAELPCALPLAFGSFGFLRGGMLLIPETLLVITKEASWVIGVDCGELARRLDSLDGAAVCAAGRAALASIPGCGATHSEGGSLSESEWCTAVATVRDMLRAGQADKVVLARDKKLRAQRDFDPRLLCAHLARSYPSCWIYAVRGLVGATPELLVGTRAGEFSCRVLAGTATADEGEVLLASEKDRREHEIAVESVRSALTPVASSLDIPEQPELLRLPNVCHLATDVRGRSEHSALGLAYALHPTAAVCGQPTALARDILTDVEHMDRGRYAGPVGWVDAAGNGEFGIALRGGHITGNFITLYAGGGIMPQSIPEAEFAETEAKMLPMLSAVAESR